MQYFIQQKCSCILPVSYNLLQNISTLICDKESIDDCVLPAVRDVLDKQNSEVFYCSQEKFQRNFCRCLHACVTAIHRVNTGISKCVPLRCHWLAAARVAEVTKCLQAMREGNSRGNVPGFQHHDSPIIVNNKFLRQPELPGRTVEIPSDTLLRFRYYYHSHCRNHSHYHNHCH